MTTLLPIFSILLALFVAACVAYLAWEITKEASGENSRPDNDSPNNESPDDSAGN